MIKDMRREASEMSSKIAEMQAEAAPILEKAKAIAEDKEAMALNQLPLAKRDGQGDLSLSSVKHKLNNKLVTSDAMSAIMLSLPNRPETAPMPKKKSSNKNSMRSVEASFNDWIQELGKY